MDSMRLQNTESYVLPDTDVLMLDVLQELQLTVSSFAEYRRTERFHYLLYRN